MKRSVPVIFALAALLLTPTFASAGPANGPQAFGVPVTGGPTLFERAAERDRLHAELSARQVADGLANPIAVRVLRTELFDMETGNATERRVRVGIVKSAGVEVSFLDLAGLTDTPQRLDRGAIRGNGDRGFDWTGAVTSPGATALRVHFTDFYLPSNAALYLYSRDGQVVGPYTHRGPRESGDFWSETIIGEELVMQLRYTGTDSARVLRSTRFVVDDVAHIGSKFQLGAVYRGAADDEPTVRERAFCSFNESCVVNNSCTSNAAVSDAEKGVAHIQFVSGAFIYICSGGLLSDTGGTQTPYFLTANHCISKGREASSMEAFFFFDTPCGGACYDPDGAQGIGRTSGATILSSNRSSDYTLMQLAQAAPTGSTLMGWNASEVAFSDGAGLYRVSHPKGAPQAFSHHTVDTSKGTCSSWPRGNWIYSTDVNGATEGGSSGSPVVNSAGQVVGQLSGACGTNVNVTCDSVNNATVDGALAAYFGQVSQWLDAGGGCTVTESPEASCTDGVDNDCDGFVDAADSDCGGGTCDLGQPGDSCTQDSECCSSKCKGKPGNKTCR